MADDPHAPTLTATPERGARAAVAALRYGPFRVEGLLGRGGMGVVYRAVDEVLDREVALKVVGGDGVGPAVRERLLREARALAALHHRNVCTVHHAGVSDDEVFIAMERLPGPSLAELLRGGRPPLAEALRLAHDIAAGLAHAHAGGLVHRDLKPGNVMLGRGGEAKLVDFGLARAIDRDDPDAASGAAASGERVGVASTDTRVAGTPLYMAPEQVAGAAVDARADVWAFGLIVHELVTGRHPLGGLATDEVLARVADGRLELGLPARGLPAGLAALVRACLAREPAVRPADGAALVAALARIERDARRRRWLAGAALATALLGGAVVAVALLRSSDERSAAAVAPAPDAAPALELPDVDWDAARPVLTMTPGIDRFLPLDDEHLVLQRGSALVRQDLAGHEQALPSLPGQASPLTLALDDDGTLRALIAPRSDEREVWALSPGATAWQRRWPRLRLPPDAEAVVPGPDGRQAAVLTGQGLTVVDAGTGAVQSSVPIAPHELLGGLGWSADGREVVLLRLDQRHVPGGGDAVEAVPTTGGSPRTLLGTGLFRHPLWGGTPMLVAGGLVAVHRFEEDGSAATLLVSALAQPAPVELHRWSELPPVAWVSTPGAWWFLRSAVTASVRLYRPEGLVEVEIPVTARSPAVAGTREGELLIDLTGRGAYRWRPGELLRPWSVAGVTPGAVVGEAVLGRRGDELVRVDAAGVRVLARLAPREQVRCAPDGSWCAVLQKDARTTVRPLDPASGQLGAVVADVSPSANGPRRIAIGPGRRVGWAHDRDVVVEDLARRSSRRYATGMTLPQDVAFTPDGRALVVTGLTTPDAANGYRANRIDLATGAITPVAADAESWLHSPLILPDGGLVLFARRFRDTWWRVPLGRAATP